MMTTKDLIKYLPFESSFKLNLLEKFDSLNADKKFIIEQVIWDTFGAIFQINVHKNLQLALDRAGRNEEKLDQTLYTRVVDQTLKEMQNESINGIDKVDLDEARKAMEVIVKQMKLAKTDKQAAKAVN